MPERPETTTGTAIPAAGPARARQYERIKLRLTLFNTALGIAAPLAFLLSGGSEALRDLAEDWTGASSLVVLIYVLIVSAAFEVITFPLDVYGGYTVERRFDLSRSTFRQWLFDWAKGQAIQLVFIVAAVEGIYALLRAAPGVWWVYAAIGFTLFFVALTALAPVLLFRIFFKFEPLPDGELKDRLLRLSERLHVSVRGVYIWKLGEKTRKANAALAGWGRTRRILLSDTLIQEHSPDEIEVVLAHEMAHQVHYDIWKGLAVQTALVFAAFFAVHLALEAWTGALGLRSVSDIANLPLLALVSGAVTLIALPVANGLSRKMEHAADAYALEKTGLAGPFASAMDKLASQNLSQKRPNRLVEIIFHSHPSVEKRIEFARSWQAKAGL
jgi:STE24 endopeptidase